MGYSNDRLSLAQEIKETLEVNGQWTPKNYAGSDIIMAVGKALAAKDAEIAKLREENKQLRKASEMIAPRPTWKEFAKCIEVQAKIEVLKEVLVEERDDE